MGKVKKLSELDVLRITGVSGKQYKKVIWHGEELIIKQFLTVHEYVDTIHSILDCCSAPDDRLAVEMIDFAIRINIISSYVFADMPKDLEKMFYIGYASGLYELVYENANKSQIDSVRESVYFYIKNLSGWSDEQL